jgi:hypothetical protein
VLVTSPGVDAVTAAVADLVTQPPADQPDSIVLNDIEQLLTVAAQLGAAIAQRVAVADSRESTVAETGRTTRSWLIEEQRLDSGAAGRKLRVARQLWRWPATEAAWLAGDISEDHVAVIFRALTKVPPELTELVEKTLLDLARDCTPADLAAAVDQILVACGADESADSAAARRYGTRGVSVAKTFGGTGSLSGTLAPTLAEKLPRALELAGKPTGPDDDRTRAQRFHDALEAIVDHFIDTADLPDTDRGERPARVIVTIDWETLKGQLQSAWGILPNGAHVSPEEALRIACNAEIVPAVLGGRGQLLHLGVGVRGFNARIRQGAIVRDGDRCVFPSCQGRRHELHHIKHFAHGGRSDLDNAAWLCAFHHWLVHEGGWTLRREIDGGYTFTSPTGRRRTSSKVPAD